MSTQVLQLCKKYANSFWQPQLKTHHHEYNIMKVDILHDAYLIHIHTICLYLFVGFIYEMWAVNVHLAKL